MLTVLNAMHHHKHRRSCTLFGRTVLQRRRVMHTHKQPLRTAAAPMMLDKDRRRR
jgi:hypothetical protein